MTAWQAIDRPPTPVTKVCNGSNLAGPSRSRERLESAHLGHLGYRSRRRFATQLLPFDMKQMDQMPSPRFRPKLQSTPPARDITPATCLPSCCSKAGRQGTNWNPSPSSIMANRPDASVTR
jgi:hypothetical protein